MCTHFVCITWLRVTGCTCSPGLMLLSIYLCTGDRARQQSDCSSGGDISTALQSSAHRGHSWRTGAHTAKSCHAHYHAHLQAVWHGAVQRSLVLVVFFPPKYYKNMECSSYLMGGNQHFSWDWSMVNSRHPYPLFKILDVHQHWGTLRQSEPNWILWQ